jgi:hypothetical protein
MTTDQGIISDLSNPFPAFRVFALEQAIKTGSSRELLDALEARQHQERHEECLLLLGYAIPAVKDRLTPGTSSFGSPPPSLADLPDRFLQGNAYQRFTLLLHLDQKAVQELLPLSGSWFQAEKDPIVAAQILRQFGDSWSLQEIPLIQGFLHSPRISLQVAALEVLTRRAPTLLSEYLPRLLTDADPRIQSLAIKGLAELDPDAAIAHFEQMLRSADPICRSSALRISIFLPFDRLKPLLLAFLAAEKDPALLEKAGLLFQHNPDLEVPFHLWEIADSAPPEKVELLKTIIQGACQNLRHSGVLKEDFPEFIERLKSWIQQRSAAKFVQECLAFFQNPDEKLRPEVEARIRQSLRKETCRQAFHQALDWPIAASLKTFLQTLLQSHLPPPPRAPTLAPEKASPAPGPSDPLLEISAAPPLPDFAPAPVAGGPGGRIMDIVSWPADQSDSLRSELTRVFQDGSSDDALQASGLRAARKFGFSDFLGSAQSALRKGDPHLVSAALEYINTFDRDHFLPRLGKYLNSPHPRIKGTAIRILKDLDVSQAVSALKAMLSQGDPNQHKAALACMIHFDFFLVRSVLTEFLVRNSHTDLLGGGLCFFQANPELENLFSLFSIEKACADADTRTILREEQEKLAHTLIITGTYSREIIASTRGGFHQRLQDEIGKKQHVSRFSPANIQPRFFSRLELLPWLREKVRSLPALSAAILLMALFIGGIPFRSSWVVSEKSAEDVLMPPPELGGASEIRGEVISVTDHPRTFVLRTQGNTRIAVRSAGARLKWLKPGHRVKARIIAPKPGSPDPISILQSVQKEASLHDFQRK